MFRFLQFGDFVVSYICNNGFQRNASGTKAAALYQVLLSV